MHGELQRVCWGLMKDKSFGRSYVTRVGCVGGVEEKNVAGAEGR